MKLGSLFDGIGGFPLAASRHGITPVWASEIEPGPMAITKKHFPDMVNLGDVTKINGAAVDPVDVITFGSPCQDLSVAGKRAGLDGARSGLFMEAVRIIKEMREAHNAPRFAVWENVPGAFSSNAGEDFRVVLEELCRVKDPGYSVPAPPGSKWEPAGLVEGSGWSIAWRVLDAQFWGVPQRRKRIFLVADFGGDSAGQILFEPESLRGDSAPGGGKGQGTAADAERGIGTTVFNESGPGWISEGVGCLRAEGENRPSRPCHTVLEATTDELTIWDMTHADEVMRPVYGDKVNTLNGRMGTGGNQVQVVCQAYDPKDLGRRPATFEDQSPTIKGRCGTGGGNTPIIRRGYKVRRLTPTECERLQGFPDGWTEGHSDTTRYKALGNSVAIPCVEFVIGGIKIYGDE